MNVRLTRWPLSGAARHILADPITEKAPEKMPCYRNSPVSVQEPVDWAADEHIGTPSSL